MNEFVTEMDGAFQELVLNLALEVNLYKDLENLLKDKQSSIIRGDIESLQSIVHEEQRLIPKIQTATRARELRASTIGAVSKLRAKTPSLKELIDLSPSHHQRELIEFREDLIMSLDQIARNNRENEFLLNSSVELVRGLVQVLLGTDEDERFHYGGRGIITEKRSQKSRVDCQI